MSDDELRLLVCVNPVGSNKPCCGGDRHSEILLKELEVGIDSQRLNARVERIYCLNRCFKGPAMRIAPGGRFFLEVTQDDIPGILDHIQSEAGERPADDDPFDFGDAIPGA